MANRPCRYLSSSLPRTFLCLLLLASVTLGAAPLRAAQPEESSSPAVLTGEGAQISYAGISVEYASAILALTSAARAIYAEDLRADMPSLVSVTIRKDPSVRTSLWTDGESQFFLTIKSLDDLAPPRQSSYFNLYGICHELGHIAMYRRCDPMGLPDGIAEGWAHYAGSVVVDEVYQRLGEKAWPVPYDYREDGAKRLSRQVEDPEALKDPTTNAAAAFYQAHQRYSGEKIFAAMNQATAGKPRGRKVMPRFVEALATITGDASCRDLFPKELLAPQVDWRTAHRRIDAAAVAGLKTTKDATGVMLQYGTGKSDGMRSTAGAGHAVVFRPPAGKWAVDSVLMYGSRYGTPEPPEDNFSIFICDQDFNLLQEITRPYRALTYGDKPAWHRFNFGPVPVPEGFYLCIYFNPAATKGFYLHYEAGHEPTHSRAALPWSFVHDVDYDWMIRAHLRPVP